METKRIPLYGRNGVRAEAIVDMVDHDGLAAFRWHLLRCYAVRWEKRRLILMHREVLRLSGGADEGFDEVDHIDGDGLNNSRANLRPATRAQNAQNRRVHKPATSSYRGVHWCSTKRRWVGEVRLNGRRAFRRYFRDQETAALAASKARRQLMPYAVEVS